MGLVDGAGHFGDIAFCRLCKDAPPLLRTVKELRTSSYVGLQQAGFSGIILSPENALVKASTERGLRWSMVKHRWLYPTNWEELAWECKERAGWCCEFCGIAHGTEVVSERTGVVYTVYLAAAHLDHDPWNPQPRLAALCPSCHARYDYSWQERQRWVELEQLRHRLWINAHLFEE